MFGYGIHTITYDNGSEFSAWQYTETDLNVSIYFADPYRSSQRGRNENTNSLIRDFIPKQTDFKKLHKKDILNIESLLNNRPRKRFNGLTPIEIAQGVAIDGLM
jgi:IS30 family transposase